MDQQSVLVQEGYRGKAMACHTAMGQAIILQDTNVHSKGRLPARHHLWLRRGQCLQEGVLEEECACTALQQRHAMLMKDVGASQWHAMLMKDAAAYKATIEVCQIGFLAADTSAAPST